MTVVVCGYTGSLLSTLYSVYRNNEKHLKSVLICITDGCLEGLKLMHTLEHILQPSLLAVQRHLIHNFN